MVTMTVAGSRPGPSRSRRLLRRPRGPGRGKATRSRWRLRMRAAVPSGPLRWSLWCCRTVGSRRSSTEMPRGSIGSLGRRRARSGAARIRSFARCRRRLNGQRPTPPRTPTPTRRPSARQRTPIPQRPPMRQCSLLHQSTVANLRGRQPPPDQLLRGQPATPLLVHLQLRSRALLQGCCGRSRSLAVGAVRRGARV